MTRPLTKGSAGWSFDPLVPRQYRVIYADPPWRFSGGTRGRPQHYPRMTLPEILALPVGDLAHPDGARLFLWITVPLLHRLPAVLDAWGFRYSSARFWAKLWPNEDGLFLFPDSLARGTGFEVIGNTEVLVIAKRGRPQPLARKWTSLVFAPRRQHSRKPDVIPAEIVERLDGPRCELFARQTRKGWTAWGNEVGRFDEPMLEAAG